LNQIERLLDRLKTLGAQVPGIESPYPLLEPTFQNGANPDEVAELGVGSLPADYLEYLSRCRALSATDVFNAYFIFSPLQVARIASGVPHVLHVTGLDGLLTEVHVLPIGGDGGGNMFLLEKGVGTQGRVWKWSHEYPTRFDGVASEGLTFLAPSFTAFLERVAEDWQHFVALDRSWHYISG